MALSCYANWVDYNQLNSDVCFFAPPSSNELLLQPPPLELLGFDLHNCVYSDYPDIYPVIYSEDYFYSDSLLPYFSSHPIEVEQPPPNYPELIYPAEDYNYKLYPELPKKQKISDEEGFTTLPLPGRFVPNPPCLLPELFLPPETPPLPPFPEFIKTPPTPLMVYNENTTSSYYSEVETTVKKPAANGGGSLSAQSIAARQRRRKITEKTQELGKHIPGGQRMNTAEMLQAAYNYIKFLQAQVSILEYLPPVLENEETSPGDRELHVLLSSSLIQEKLYSADKCLVPTKFAQNLLQDNSIQSNTRILDQVKKLLQ